MLASYNKCRSKHGSNAKNWACIDMLEVQHPGAVLTPDARQFAGVNRVHYKHCAFQLAYNTLQTVSSAEQCKLLLCSSVM